MQRKVDVHRSSFIVHRSSFIVHCHLVLRPASSQVRGPRFEVLCPMSSQLRAVSILGHRHITRTPSSASGVAQPSVPPTSVGMGDLGGPVWPCIHFPTLFSPCVSTLFFTPVLFTAVRHPLFEPTQVSGTEIGFIAEACACCWVRCVDWDVPLPGGVSRRLRLCGVYTRRRGGP